jgi:hypothetical protein
VSVQKKFGQIISFLTQSVNGIAPLTGVDAPLLLDPSGTGEARAALNLAASFLILLSGPSSRKYEEAELYIHNSAGAGLDRAAKFLSTAKDYILREVAIRYDQDMDFRKSLDDLHAHIEGGPPSDEVSTTRDRIWSLFFPEGVFGEPRAEMIALLREKRKVRISSLNNEPICYPEREVLFTANILVTLPDMAQDNAPDMDKATWEDVKAAVREPQRYWYDHPIPVGTKRAHNELIYGMQNLSRAVLFEERRGTKDPGRNIDCVLSVSVTHRGLHRAARRWLATEIADAGGIRGINLYLFTEDDTRELLDAVLVPAAQHFLGGPDVTPLREVFGIDGEYGRHYSFLKAIARLWNVLVSTEKRATFKIDLDQVFPQEELVRRTGASAFQHLCTPLWGAQGIDSEGQKVCLGMIAGTLVNKKDIRHSLFLPDVPAPARGPEGDEWIFWSAVPQALSTEAEMAAGYGKGDEIDGVSSCLQRVHVTGGTTGILVDSLRRYRPFTPSVFGRAEDQAYLLSVMYKPDERGFLRCAHAHGLVMRHDTEAFARDALEKGRGGKMAGDYVRMLLYSSYARALPWPCHTVKGAVDPFTGCFISRIPVTVACLRFITRASRLLSSQNPEEGLRFFSDGVTRLSGIVESLASGKNIFHDSFPREKQGWDLYYDVLDALEMKISEGDSYASALCNKANTIINALRIEK